MPIILQNWVAADLEDLESNKYFYHELKRDKYKKLIYKIDDYVSMYKSSGMFYCLDDKLQKITYRMTYKTDKNKQLNQYAWQSTVWSMGGLEYLDGLPAKMLFDFLLPICKVVVMDSAQSFDGKRFWLNCIRKAFDKKLNVYYFDVGNKELIKMEDFNFWLKFSDTKDIWGITNAHSMKRMLITPKELL